MSKDDSQSQESGDSTPAKPSPAPETSAEQRGAEANLEFSEGKGMTFLPAMDAQTLQGAPVGGLIAAPPTSGPDVPSGAVESGAGSSSSSAAAESPTSGSGDSSASLASEGPAPGGEE
jgi:hypothetical protein